MKILYTTLAALGATLMLAAPAAAKTWAQCDYEARQYALSQSNPGASAVGGAVAGGLTGLFISSITGNTNTAGAIAAGAGVGAVGGFLMSNANHKKWYDAYMANCVGPQPVQPIYAPIAPGQAMVKTGANVRTGPGTNFPAITQLAGGTIVNLGQMSPNGWCSIGFYAGSGWMACSLLVY
jgi:hypothetical protein